MTKTMNWDSPAIEEAAYREVDSLRRLDVDRVILFDLGHSLAEIEAILGHKLPEYGSNKLMEDCRSSRPDFAAALIAAAKFIATGRR